MASRQPQVSGASKRMCSSRALALTLVFWALLEFDNVDGHAHEVKLSANDLFAKGIEDSVRSLAASVLSNYQRRQAIASEPPVLLMVEDTTSQKRLLLFFTTLLYYK
ncbi:hypothetical protein R1sor_025690 [Riccia sorocarpa]|uniref:Uncharacterized protein n=1 Tax=Riccia sorocarpa TaxID=122646 RepID=A0ABD3GC20_9MARC